MTQKLREEVAALQRALAVLSLSLLFFSPYVSDEFSEPEQEQTEAQQKREQEISEKESEWWRQREENEKKIADLSAKLSTRNAEVSASLSLSC